MRSFSALRFLQDDNLKAQGDMLAGGGIGIECFSTSKHISVELPDNCLIQKVQIIVFRSPRCLVDTYKSANATQNEAIVFFAEVIYEFQTHTHAGKG
jgi:hypothetical protein